MAQDVRSRSALTLAAIAAAIASGCSDPPQQPAPAAAPVPRVVDTAAIAANELVDAVLRECHAPLRGQMAQVAATVTLPDGSSLRLFAELPDKLRVQSPAGRFLLRDDRVTRLDPEPAGAAAADAARVRGLLVLLDAAAFGPLHRATACRRLGPATFELSTPAGPPTTLVLRTGTLLPSAFTTAGTTATITDYLRTPTTWVASELELGGLGRCRVVFDARIRWDPDLFRDPATPATTAPRGTQRIASPGSTAETRSPTPVEHRSSALQWIVVADPGDWPRRVDVYRPLHDEIERQGQKVAGFPVFFTENGERWLAAPFRARPDGREFVPPAGWQVRAVDAGTWLVVFPPDGDLAQRLAAGERLLQDALRTHRRRATGPITAQPYFHLHEGEPTAAKLTAPVVRMAVKVD